MMAAAIIAAFESCFYGLLPEASKILSIFSIVVGCGVVFIADKKNRPPTISTTGQQASGRQLY